MKEYIEREALISALRKYQYPYGVEFLVCNQPSTKVIEAPCDIGDVFWKVDSVNKRVERVKVSGLTKKANGTWKIRITCHYGVYEIVQSEIGKHVFQSEEEAEVALNEGEH